MTTPKPRCSLNGCTLFAAPEVRTGGEHPDQGGKSGSAEVA